MTQKSIVIFGAGPGMGVEVGRKYGQQGYQVVLVARRKERLDQFVAELEQEGITAFAVPGDLTKIDEIPALIKTIRGHVGEIHAIYHGPETAQGFVPAYKLTVDLAKTRLDLLFLSLVAILNEVLPEMRARKSGDILTAFGGSAADAHPFLSGPGPAMAATRNMLFALHGELAREGIYVGILTVSAFVNNSDAVALVAAGEYKLDLPEGIELPEAFSQMPFVHGYELAEVLWDAAQKRTDKELFYPPRG
jgi:short-subunit dehydrogenase